VTSPPLSRSPYGDPRVNPFRSPTRDRDDVEPGEWYRVGPVVALAPAPATPDTGQDDTGAAAATRADVYVYDMLGGWFGMTAGDFVRDVGSLDVDELHVHLNSPGGDVDEGVAIANVLRQHSGRVVVHVDGMAASAASVVAMAGDEVVMGIGSQLMVHDAWGVAIGNSAEITAYARRLDSTSDAIATTYAARTGGTAAEWRDVMRTEQWYTADEAVAAGLADRVATDADNGTATGDPITPGAAGGLWDMWAALREPDRFDLSAYAYAGREDAPAPAMPGRQTPAAPAAGNIQQEGSAVAFSDEQLSTMRQRLGLADDADEQTIVDAMGEALDEQTAEPAPVAAQLPEGVVAVDAAQLEQLRAAAQRGEDARTRQEREDREALVTVAVADGRIAPARRDHWVAALEADPGSAATLAALTPGLIPVDAPRGHDGPAAAADSIGDDYWFSGVVGANSAREG
jgi:ATP-dependent protease ClpP protease subunit